jgi:hypothetical protein
MTTESRLRVVLALLMAVSMARVHAEGEAVNGFPNWSERVLLEWSNRARSDPQVEMTSCGARCGDAACYSPIAPLRWSANLAHSARFHTENMAEMGFFAHDSACTLVNNIATLYPSSCDASASCSCVGGVPACNPGCTTWYNRIGLFGSSASAEIIASASDPNSAFYQWLYENYATLMLPPNCQYVQGPPTNGHRWDILTSTGTVGAGQTASTASVMDFSSSASTSSKIPSGSHYPQQATNVDAWANWYDTAGPSVTKIDVDGVCSDMSFARGPTQANSAWLLTVNGVGSGCHRYFFAFKDSAGGEVLYPTTGSLAIGDGSAQCPDWSSAAPAGCAGFDRIFANGFEP